jgi:adenylate kinase
MSRPPDREGWFRGSNVACKPAAFPRKRTYRLVLLGPPGVGKGAQAELLCDRLGTCHLAMGDLFRASSYAAEPSPAMAAAHDAMRDGELVSDELVISIFRERSACLRCHGGFVLDGFPRTLAQAEFLEIILRKCGVALDAVLSYELPLDEIVDRIGGRRTCAKCKAVYHITALPTAKDANCDRCSGELIQREDDRPDAVRVRMQTYTEATRPLTEFYAKRKNLISISADGQPDEIFERSLLSLEKHLGVPIL